jgi:hypothetical protein
MPWRGSRSVCSVRRYDQSQSAIFASMPKQRLRVESYGGVSVCAQGGSVWVQFRGCCVCVYKGRGFRVVVRSRRTLH